MVFQFALAPGVGGDLHARDFLRVGVRGADVFEPSELLDHDMCWAPDGRSIYMQDLDNLHQIGLDGAEIKSWKLESLIPKGSFSSASRFAVSPDGRTLLMEVEMDEPITRKDWEGPPPALWTLDLATQKTTRLTPKGLFGMDGCWSGDAEIIFTSQAAGEKEPSLHRLSLPGNERKQFLKKACAPSISR